MITVKQFIRRNFAVVAAMPALLWQLYLLYIPIASLILYSFFLLVDCTVHGFTLIHYQQLLNFDYLLVFLNSLWLGISTSASAFLIGYPVAHFLAFKAGRYKMPLLVTIILPSWTSFIVQVYAWFFLLKYQGIASSIAYHLRITNGYQHFIGTPFAQYLGMVYCYLPFMIFPLFAVLERVDSSLIEASADLGANRFTTLRRIIFPLSLPGVYAGFLLVFIPAFGEFAIPDLLGGAKTAYIGSVIVDKFITFNNWESGSALITLAIILPLLSMVATFYFVLYVYSRFYKQSKRVNNQIRGAWHG